MTNINMALNIRAAAVVLAIAMAGGCAYAQAEMPEIELAPMTVSAHDGLSQPRNQTGVSVEVLDVQKLRQEGNLTLAQALTTVPGVNIQSGGGDNQQGNVANVSIRGMSSDTSTLAIMDGMRLYNTGGGGLLTSNVIGRTELFSIGNAEVLKGSQGATYGGGAMGGVIFMETPRGNSEPKIRLFNEAGSHDSYNTNATAQGQEGELSYFLTATYTRTDNDIEFAGGATPSHRNAGEYESWQEALRLDWQPDDDNLLTLTYRRED